MKPRDTAPPVGALLRRALLSRGEPTAILGLLSRALAPCALVLCSLLVAACRPDLGDRESLITSPRVLAVRAEPPEAKPGAAVTFEVLVASPDGTLPDPAATWAFCDRARPLADNRSVSADCLGDDAVEPIPGAGATVTGTLPKGGCSTFGPDVISAKGRPRDADVTGGYYQPVRIRTAGTTAFGLERLTCDLANAPVDAVQDYLARYEPNRNPAIAALTAQVESAAPTPAAALDAVPPGASVTFELSWTDADAETYPVFDPDAQALVDHRESLRVSWFATNGQLESDRTGRDETDLATSTRNTWTAPRSPTTVFLWAVLRDSRGGATFTAFEAHVAP